MRVLKLALAGLLAGVAAFLVFCVWWYGPVADGTESRLRACTLWLPKGPLREIVVDTGIVTVLGSPVLLGSLFLIQRMSRRPGRLRWPAVLGMPAIFCLGWSGILSTLFRMGWVPRGMGLDGVAGDVFYWSLFAVPLLLWNLGWAFEAVRREKAPPAV